LVPNQRHGIPQCWAGFIASDPPVFESEPTYIRRHRLWLPGEERRVRERDFDDQVEIDFDPIPKEVLDPPPEETINDWPTESIDES
jgi:hypothetical protein